MVRKFCSVMKKSVEEDKGPPVVQALEALRLVVQNPEAIQVNCFGGYLVWFMWIARK
jgi:hypothetical protein